jgi:DNA-binding NarL/FixJ family response regulator
MWRTIIIYGLALAGGVFLLEWLQFQYLARQFGIEIFIAVIAMAFGVLGIWTGMKLTPKPVSTPFAKNDAALKSLGITAREYEVLIALSAGQSNKEIARSLDVSPNTIKTHLARLFEKLEVTRRMQAIDKARQLQLIA